MSNSNLVMQKSSGATSEVREQITTQQVSVTLISSLQTQTSLRTSLTMVGMSSLRRRGMRTRQTSGQ